MIETGWGPLEVRDAHVHFFSHRFFELLTGAEPAVSTAKLGWDTPPEAPEGLAGGAGWIGVLMAEGALRVDRRTGGVTAEVARRRALREQKAGAHIIEALPTETATPNELIEEIRKGLLELKAMLG